MALRFLLLVQWTSLCSSLSSLTVCEVSSNVEVNSVSVDCHGRGLTEIPKDFPANTTFINLSYNLISSVTNHSFHGISSLQSLDLSNNVISKIEALAFWNCQLLKTLNINDNRVCVNGSVFETLGNLRELAVDDCYAAEVFKTLSFLTTISIKVDHKCKFEGFQYLTNLRKLNIQGVFICQNDTFANLNSSNIQSLFITSYLLHMEINALSPLKHLQELIFASTATGLSFPLNALYGLVGRNLTTLIMDRVRIIKGAIPLKTIEDRTLTKESLKYLSQICVSTLSLKNNLILFIDFNFLLNSPIAKCLKRLNLNRNMIGYVPMMVYSQFWKLKQLEYLSIADQAIIPISESLVPKPSLLFDRFWQNPKGKGGVILRFPEFLKEVIFNNLGNHLDRIDFDVTIINGDRIKKIDFSFNGLITLENIFGLHNLVYLDLSGNERLRLPDGFFCNVKKTEILRMSDMSFPQSVITAQGKRFFRCLPRLETFNISGNRLVQLPTDLFDHNPMLQYLDLSRNIFISIPVQFNLLPNLHLLDVSSNSLGSLEKKTTIDIDTHYENTNKTFQLHLEGDFLECSCTNFPFLFWLSETEVLAETKENLTCITEDGNITNTGRITEDVVTFWRECKGSETFSISSVLGTVIMCCILVALLVDTNKTKLAYMFIYALKHQAPKRRRKDFERDVYVSYADMDYRWACHELCAILEQRDLSLFIWDRDAVPGDYTAEVITENVNQCWKTILYFTENYEQDAWGYLTTMAAVNCVDNLNPERLILLLPKNENPRVPECLLQVVPESCIFHVPPEIRRNDAFWDELEKAIKRET